MGARGHEVDLHEVGICPGFLVRMPAVQEGVQAYVALTHGELRTFFPGEQASLLEAALIVQQTFNLYELHQQKEAASRRT
jgi:hypothetical protein